MAFKSEAQIVHLYRGTEVRACMTPDEEKAARAAGFSEYERSEHQYPKSLYRGLETIVVKSAAEDKSMQSDGWTDKPTKAFFAAQADYGEIPEVRSAVVQLSAPQADPRVAQLEAQLAEMKRLFDAMATSAKPDAGEPDFSKPAPEPQPEATQARRRATTDHSFKA